MLSGWCQAAGRAPYSQHYDYGDRQVPDTRIGQVVVRHVFPQTMAVDHKLLDRQPGVLKGDSHRDFDDQRQLFEC